MPRPHSPPLAERPHHPQHPQHSQHPQHPQHQHLQHLHHPQHPHPQMSDVCKQEEMGEPQSPISRLPPELLFRILTFVGLAGGPSSLRSCNLSCKGFYEIIEDPALDKYIYRAAAFSLLSHDARLFPQPTLSGTRVPPTTSATTGVTKQTFKALARTLHLSRRPFPAKLHNTSTTSIPPKGIPCPTTRHGPNPAIHNWVTDDFRALTYYKHELSAAKALPPLSVDPQGRPVHRIIDFVHSSTEASRTEEGIAYIGVKTCGWSDALPPGKTSPRQGETASWILFSDDPRVFPEKRDRGWVTVQRAAILGGAPSTSPSNMPPGQRLQQLHQEKVEAAAGRKKVDPSPYGTPPPPTAREIAEAEAAWSPFIKPIDHDKFLNAQRWGDVTRGLNASAYKALPKNKSILPQQEKLASWSMANVSNAGLVGFGKCQLHSDANLRLIPRLVQRQLEVAQVERLSMENTDGDVEVNMIWEMPRTVQELSLEPLPADEEMELDWDEDINEVNWEFKSCGGYLIVCDDNSARRSSTISCFSGHVPATTATKTSKKTTREPPRWQRRMAVKRTDGNGEYWLDNDGISVNSSIVAYSTRRHIYPGNTHDSHKAVMEFHILSLRTGDTIKVLNLADEERAIAQRCWMWCSFALGDGILVASLGGLGAAISREEEDGPWAGIGRRKRYGYENLFVWDLGDESSSPKTAQVGAFRGETELESRSLLVSPRGRIPVPQGWGEVDKYVVLSGCGRFLGVCAEWKMAVWDLEQKTFEGLWRVKDADILEVESVGVHIRDEFNHRDDECVPWNGLWIKWRDVIDSPTSSQPEVVKQSLTYVNSRDLRRAVGGVDLEMDRRRAWLMAWRLANVDDPLDDSDSDSDSEGSAWMAWGDGAAGAWEDAEYGDDGGGSGGEGDSDVDPAYMGWA